MNETRCKDCVAAAEEFPHLPPPKVWRPVVEKSGGRCATHWRVEKKRRREAAHEKAVQRTYGLSEGEYEALYEFQGGKCALCRRATGKTRRLSVDHDHKTGVVRQLACRPCNTLLGHFRDDPETFRRIAEVLDSPPAVEILGYRGGDEMETWKDVPGYDGWYQASSMGRVRSWRGVGKQSVRRSRSEEDSIRHVSE